ncbi:hypothetical protein [Roseibium denhamense]|uniref:Uncharacterized protein n=1 Tax=Roseibium denhamense TaxID=76305 RepID=A0ABY1PA05_9HYPH|nr:hypothetical protein [Roseibium denhamense]SMP29056.1 hypothetical protein SAMN06265374_3054 [Roseibium denhamense]
MSRRSPLGRLPEHHYPCLTEMSLPALMGGALVLSGLLWLAILAVW